MLQPTVKHWILRNTQLLGLYCEIQMEWIRQDVLYALACNIFPHNL
jgi:hypothetical protein